MRPAISRPFLALLTTTFLMSTLGLAFQSPLSDEAIREAYFLGQRRDESMAHFLNQYTRVLPPPDSGPHIYSVTFLTPFALVVQQSSQRPNYSAQQAEKEHHPDEEVVSISIEILLTQSYPALIARPIGSRSDSPIGIQLRNPDFWKEFRYSVFDDEKEHEVDSPTGEPTYRCDGDGGCDLTGATVHFQLPASLFASGFAAVEVDPKVADPTYIEFELSSLR